MKLLTLLPFLAATAFASTADPSAADPAPSDAAAETPPEDPTPAGALWTASWNDSTLSPYTKSCATKSTYKAAIYTLKQLYPDLETFAPQLKVFYNKQLYPGSWSGVDKHGNDRELLKMDMADLPWKVREWIKKESTQRHYSVHDDIVFFAPGAIYPILPLWVEGGDEVGCSGKWTLNLNWRVLADCVQACLTGSIRTRMSRRMVRPLGRSATKRVRRAKLSSRWRRCKLN